MPIVTNVDRRICVLDGFARTFLFASLSLFTRRVGYTCDSVVFYYYRVGQCLKIIVQEPTLSRCIGGLYLSAFAERLLVSPPMRMPPAYCIGVALATALSVRLSAAFRYCAKTVWARITKLGHRNGLDPQSILTQRHQNGATPRGRYVMKGMKKT